MGSKSFYIVHILVQFYTDEVLFFITKANPSNVIKLLQCSISAETDSKAYKSTRSMSFDLLFLFYHCLELEL